LFLRPPYQMTLRIMTWMESLSISTTSKMLDYGGTIHVVQGNTLGLPSHDFRIDHICSSWVSLVSMVACAAVICVVRNRRLSHCLVVFLMSLLSTWVLNIVRIYLVINVKIRYGLDLIDSAYVGIYHFMSFMLGIGLVLCTDALVVFLYSRAKKDVVDSDMIRRAKSPLARLWTWVSHIELSRLFAYFVSLRPAQIGRVSFVVIVLMLGSLIAMEAVVTYHRQAVTKMEFMYDEDGLTKLDENSFVPDRDGWELTSYDTERRDIMNVWGAFSSTWRLKYNGLTVTFSLDYPFHEWHDVKRCYYKVGWQLVDEKILRSLPSFEWQASETDMLIPNGDAGYILCSNCDHLGGPVVPKPAKHDISMLVYRLQPSQMTPPFGDSYDQDRRTLYQTQCMVANPRPLDDATKEQIRLMYVDFREQIRRAIASQSQNK
ncbi:MAG: exosortase U, partial [Akkermansiaceae bacterium]|nr:exosortase U [Akkermansiaceae bacterium]